jgi:hypothetical protein
MARSPSLSTLPSAYNDFLYANVGVDRNGALLTVLSVLARQNVDPWAEAADMSRLPRDSAARRLLSMIAASPGYPSTADQTAVADRLVALLPRGIAPSDKAANAQPVAPLVQQSPPTGTLRVIAIYIGVLLLSEWIAASVFEKAPVNAAPASSLPRSTSGETPVNDGRP